MTARHTVPRSAVARTANRIATLERLIDMLRKGELMRDAAAVPLKIKERTARAYFDELRQGGIVEIARRTERGNNLPGQPVFRLAADDARIRSFLATVGVGPRSVECKPPPSELAIASRMPGRRFHIMQDDGPAYAIRVHNERVRPDPHALPAAFFSRPTRVVHA